MRTADADAACAVKLPAGFLIVGVFAVNLHRVAGGGFTGGGLVCAAISPLANAV